jgi:uncharacterized protein
MMAFRTVLHYLGRFLLFWRDFLIGDDWWGAGIVLLGFGLTYLVVRRDAPAFWVLALFVAISLVQSLWRTKRNDKHETRSSAVPPTRANGKVCYIEIPATDIPLSADFYGKVFGWNIRRSTGGRTAFDDTIGEVSGSWVLGRLASAEPGLLIYIMVDSVEASVEAVIANGGEIVQPIGADAPELTARFRDPGGNVLGLYQEPSASGSDS